MKRFTLLYIVMTLGGYAMMSCSDSDIISDDVEKQTTRSITDDIIYFQNKSVSTNETVSGGTIQVSDVTVTNKAKLSLMGTKTVIIDKSFTVEADSQLEIDIIK